MRKRDWDPLLFLTSASVNKGIEALYEGIWSHFRYLKQDSKLEERRKKQFKQELHTRIENEFAKILWKDVVEKRDIDKIVDDIWQRQADPQNAAQRLSGHLWAMVHSDSKIIGSAASQGALGFELKH